MTSLYEISEDITKIAAAMEAAETVEEQDEVAKQRDSLQMDFNTKIENVLKVMRDAETDAIKIKAEAVRLAQLAESKTKLAERLKMYVSTILQIQGIEKLDLDLFKLSFRPSENMKVTDEGKDILPENLKTSVFSMVPETEAERQLWLEKGYTENISYSGLPDIKKWYKSVEQDWEARTNTIIKDYSDGNISRDQHDELMKEIADEKKVYEGKIFIQTNQNLQIK